MSATAAPDSPPTGPNSAPDQSTKPGLMARVIALLKPGARSRNGENGWRESIEELLVEHDSDDDSSLGDEERQMLANIAALGDKRVENVMVPRVDIVALEAGMSLSEIVDRYRAAPHSRLPVYRENLDEIVGVLHIKDLVNFWGHTGEIDLQSVLRPPLIAPPSKPVIDLMVEMRDSRRHMAIVVDEYGGVDGLATIEDLIEEVVGDIRDEHDIHEPPGFEEMPDGSIMVEARHALSEFEERVGCDLLADEEDEDIDTLGGFVFMTLGRVPTRGEILRHECGLEFEITEADARRIRRMRVRRRQPTPTPSETGDDSR